MKKFLVLALFILSLTVGFVQAKEKNTMPVIKFAGAKYYLLYSAKSSETGGFLNEYYKANQTYASWTELIGIHHYPTAFYPIEHAKEFNEYLNKNGVVSNIEIDDTNNTALIYFIIMNDAKLPIIMEFNIFKYQKSPVCGSIGIQYARRYRLNNTFEINKAKKDILKKGMKYIKRLDKLKPPSIIELEVENGKYLLKEGCNNDIKNLD